MSERFVHISSGIVAPALTAALAGLQSTERWTCSLPVFAKLTIPHHLYAIFATEQAADAAVAMTTVEASSTPLPSDNVMTEDVSSYNFSTTLDQPTPEERKSKCDAESPSDAVNTKEGRTDTSGGSQASENDDSSDSSTMRE